jgi:hypothetical protein
MYQGSASVATGGQFLLDQNFALSGGSDASIASMTVSLTNSAGNVTSATVPYSGFAASCN